jgi:hypothetical protein
MKEMSTGSLVKHRSLGMGKVVAVEANALHVFFPGSDTRYAAKLRWPAVSPFLSREDLEPNAWLEGLTSFALDSVSGRYALAANFISQDEAIGLFLEEHPKGFAEVPAARAGGVRRERAARWRAAAAEWIEVFGNGQGERYLEDGNYGELSRRALRVAAHAAGIPGMVEVEDLKEAFEPGDVVRHYFDALFGYLSVPSPARARFERLCAASNSLGVPADAAWPMATFFPFVAVPSRQLVLVPRSASGGASRLGCDLQYQAAPNWVTYSRLRDLSARLLEKLQPSGAKDLIDVEVFLHATGARRPAAAVKRARAAAAPKNGNGKKAAKEVKVKEVKAKEVPTKSRRKR